MRLYPYLDRGLQSVKKTNTICLQVRKNARLFPGAQKCTGERPCITRSTARGWLHDQTNDVRTLYAIRYLRRVLMLF